MSSNERSNAFNEVRAILGKLERSIDEARTRRLEPELPVRREATASPTSTARHPHGAPASPAPARPSPDLDREIGGTPASRAKTELQKKSATFGRAKPLNRPNERHGSGTWKTHTSKEDGLIG